MTANNEQYPTDSQKRYWHFMYELIVHNYYLQSYLLWYQSKERGIKCFLAIMSSSAIASWVIWKEFSYLWAFLIAASQVISSVKHLLPFNQREGIIRNVLPELNRLSCDVEMEYYYVSNGIAKDVEIHQKTIEFKRRKNDLITPLDVNVLPENFKLMDEAEAKTKLYLKGYYGG